ncbi:translation initiation factor IF-2 [Scytonema millei]|uniref:Translation initiation factor IF-2 n=1 Tax=Scytonema millei VB511283 TaxID=1245923 RepID=A0A9X5E1P7_9CYAN|nr:translation initiation factor IF-2 [Scytonema millei]NHC33607.1 translation initiation factor IF-2 [Scytonema millei VB511283]
MNNGKVRIYDLSKELNLDNKEILAICDRLNIAVKSHSSTISEEEAERIRQAAEKQAANPVTAGREGHANSYKAHPQPATNKVKPKPVVPHKQQILEIRKPKHNPDRPNPPEPSVAVAPQPPARPTASNSPVRPTTAPTRPEAQKPVQAVETQPTTQSEQGDNSTHTNKSRSLESPKLSTPPPRPSGARDGVDETAGLPPSPPQRAERLERSERPERPILKREQDDRAANRPVAKADRVEKPMRRSQEAAASSESTPARPKPVLELQRPKPVRAGEAVAPERSKPEGAEALPGTEEIAEIGVDDKPILKRPMPRPVGKGGKKWQEEEIDEGQDAKATKAGVKTKRLKPIVDLDDEEDFDDEEDGDGDTPIQVSLSIARPPKQKTAARPGQPQPAAISVVRSKKFSQARENNRRREPEQKRERPEKVVVMGNLTVQELAESLATPDTEIVKILFMKGIAVSITQSLDLATIKMVAEELGVEVETAEPEAEARKVTEMLDAADLENLQRRPPVVTIMGHVDHGKTTLLDAIRKTKVAQGEAGGITQHIGAYHVDVEQNGQMQQVVFLDTPGHEAFTAMRARGARVTDIAILVVAADDGVQPQTVEAISHAQAAEVPIVVAINKIDKEGAQPDRVKQELTQYSLTPEEWGGDTIMVPVSAIKGENLDGLLEMILLVAEVEDLYANPDRTAKGTVIEAHLDKAKGPVATLLVQNGTLHVGDILVAGSAFGKVRAMVDDRGRRVDIASPSFAVEVLGLSDVPAAGDDFEVYLVEKEARAIANERAEKQRQFRLLQGRATLTSISAQAQEGELKELNLILKADVQGSVEAIVGALKQLPQNEVQIRMLLSAPGEVTETDIDLAAASNAVIIGFNTTLASGARQAADEAGVDVREYDIIYKLLEDIQAALEGMLEPELVEEPLGQAEVRQVFPVGRGKVAGSYVQSGKLVRNCKLRVRRGGKVIYEGALDSLKRMREDAREVNSGYECGIGVDKFNDWVEGDIVEAYQMVTKRRTLTR